MKRKAFIIALSLVGMLAFTGCAANAATSGAKVSEFQTAQATLGNIEQAVSAPGVLKFVDPVSQKAVANLKITDVSVKVGDTVKTGDVLASYDAAALSANIASLTDTVSQLEQQLKGLALSFRSDRKIPAGIKGYVKEVYIKKGDSVDAIVAEKGGIALISADGLMNVQFSGTGVTANEKVTVVSGRYRVDGHVSKVADNSITVSFPDKRVLVGSTVEIYKGTQLLGSGEAQVDLPYLVPADSGIVTEVKVDVNDYVMPMMSVARVKYVDLDESYLAAQTQLTQAQKDLDAAKALLTQGAVLAEQDGIVSFIVPEGTYQNGMKLMDFYPEGQFEFTISVDELDIFSIALGQTGVVRFDGIQDQDFAATVIKISSMGQVANGFTTYAVTLSVTDNGTLKSGLNGTVKIILQQRENVLTLPLNALQEDSEGYFVLLASDPQSKVRVTVGVSDGSKIEIASGLSEGDVVNIQPAADLSSFAQ
jgi:multidrug efflux pump subunit AcrA (membrane-fusion protein)